MFAVVILGDRGLSGRDRRAGLSREGVATLVGGVNGRWRLEQVREIDRQTISHDSIVVGLASRGASIARGQSGGTREDSLVATASDSNRGILGSEAQVNGDLVEELDDAGLVEDHVEVAEDRENEEDDEGDSQGLPVNGSVLATGDESGSHDCEKQGC